jgi:hypothetical protein
MKITVLNDYNTDRLLEEEVDGKIVRVDIRPNTYKDPITVEKHLFSTAILIDGSAYEIVGISSMTDNFILFVIPKRK